MARRALAVACLALAATGVLADDSLGTLFLTPTERARLDALRRGEPAADTATRGAPRDHARALTGYVQRSDGRTTLWIDGRPVSVPASKAPKLEPRDVQDTLADAPRIERTDPR
jgi:hypothetical protein